MINATVTRMANGGWSFTWAVGVAPYTVWLDGVLLDTVNDEEYEFTQPNYEDAPPDLEILNDGPTSESATYPPFVILQWRGVLGAVAYVVEEFVGAAWIVHTSVQETGRGYYSWRSLPLDDEASLLFRVVPVDLSGNAGTSISFSMEMCRNPAHPEVDIEINPAGDVIVSAV